MVHLLRFGNGRKGLQSLSFFHFSLLSTLLIGTLLFCSSLPSAHARRVRKSKSFEKFQAKNFKMAKFMGSPRIGAYLRVGIIVGSYDYKFTSEKTKLTLTPALGGMAFGQLGINLWSNFGLHFTYGQTKAIAKKATLSVDGTDILGQTSLQGHSVGAGFIWRPFYRRFYVERMKRYRSITGSFPAPPFIGKLMNGLYLSADCFVIKSNLEFSRGTGSKVNFTMGLGVGAMATVGYEMQIAKQISFDFGAAAMYSQNPSQNIVGKENGSEKETELQGRWGNIALGIRATLTFNLPDRTMIRGLF